MEKTIDKCHPDCRECNEKESIDNTNCISCPSNKYLYLGNCIDNCANNDYFIDKNDTSKKICKCPNTNCLECSFESYNLNLCISFDLLMNVCVVNFAVPPQIGQP